MVRNIATLIVQVWLEMRMNINSLISGPDADFQFYYDVS